MILKRYGTSFQSVEADFDSKALNEISFRRDRRFSVAAEDFERDYESVSVHELDARADGDVHDETEQKLLEDLLGQLEEIVEGAGEGELVVIESEQGKDWPKTRQEQKNVIVEGENRLHFHIRVEPPLRVGVYRKGE
jgi:hypothetical protein